MLNWFCWDTSCPRYNRRQSPYEAGELTSNGCLTCGQRLHVTPADQPGIEQPNDVSSTDE